MYLRGGEDDKQSHYLNSNMLKLTATFIWYRQSLSSLSLSLSRVSSGTPGPCHHSLEFRLNYRLELQFKIVESFSR